MLEELKKLMENRINYINLQINLATTNGDINLLSILETQLEEATQILNQLRNI